MVKKIKVSMLRLNCRDLFVSVFVLYASFISFVSRFLPTGDILLGALDISVLPLIIVTNGALDDLSLIGLA